MLILGAGGHAKEVFDIIKSKHPKDLAFYDDITPLEQKDPFFHPYLLLRNPEEMQQWFRDVSPKFVLGVGGINARSFLRQKALAHGGECSSFIADNATISSDSTLATDINIMQLAFVSSSVQLGQSVLVNTRANIHHDVTIGDFSEIGPGALLLGRSIIGRETFIGAGAIVLPNVMIGNNCIIGAGAVVTKNIPNNMKVKGNPAK